MIDFNTSQLGDLAIVCEDLTRAGNATDTVSRVIFSLSCVDFLPIFGQIIVHDLRYALDCL